MLSRLCLAALLGCLLCSSASASTINVTAGDTDGLIQAFIDANNDTDDWTLILIQGSGTFVFADEFPDGDGDHVLPPLRNTRVALVVVSGPVTIDLSVTSKGSGSGPPFGLLQLFESIFFILSLPDYDPQTAAKGGTTPPLTLIPSIDIRDPVFEADDSVILIENMEIPRSNAALVEADDTQIIVKNVLVSAGSIFVEPALIFADHSTSPAGTMPSPQFGSLALQALQAAGANPATLRGKFDRLAELTTEADVVIDGLFATLDFATVLTIDGTGGTTSRIRNSLMSVGDTSRVIELGGDDGFVDIANTVLRKGTFNEAISVDSKELSLTGVTIDAEDAIEIFNGNVTTTVTHSILGNADGFNQTNTTQGVCKFSSLVTLVSGGFNIAADDSCDLNGPGDIEGSDPLIDPPPTDGLVPTLNPNSPAIDAGANVLLNEPGGKGGLPQFLPCGYKDLFGLARPQDFGANSVFNCDIGAVEAQGGPDIGAPQSAAYFDPNRNGEGAFVEILDGGLAFVAEFTYTPNGSGPAWFVGIGEVTGNSVVVDDMLITSGGVFGDAFDAGAIDREKVGSLSFNFPTCEAGGKPGKQSFQAALNSPYEDLLATSLRLSTVVGCSGPPPVASGRSGSFFDPARDGEGIFVQWLDTGQVVVIWYTYDTQGNQFWTISGEATVMGSTVTASMLYPATSTRFGSRFDPDDIDLQNWGTVTLTYTGCDQVRLDYDSVVAGFGSGSLNYTRLTKLSGTSCDL